MPDSIQPGEHSTGGGAGGILYATDSDGNPNIFDVEHDDNGRWLNDNYGNPDNVWNGNNRFVFVRRKSLHFSPGFPGEFRFESCPFQPPSIRPTSSIRSDSAMYFLSSIDFVSQRTIRRILSVSAFRMQTRT